MADLSSKEKQLPQRRERQKLHHPSSMGFINDRDTGREGFTDCAQRLLPFGRSQTTYLVPFT